MAILHHYSDNLQGTRGNILSGPFVPLSSPYPPDSLKSSLICETLVSWYQIDWWDPSHPYVYFNRQARHVLGHQQDWKDDKLCHDAPSNIAPNRPANMMIALSLLRNHHYNGQLSTTEPLSTFEHYKNPTIIEQKGGDCEFYDLSPYLRVSILSNVWLGLRRVCPSNLSGHLCTRMQEAQILASEQELTRPLPNGGIHPQLTWYQQHWYYLSSLIGNALELWHFFYC